MPFIKQIRRKEVYIYIEMYIWFSNTLLQLITHFNTRFTSITYIRISTVMRGIDE